MPRMPASAGRKEHKAGLKGDAKILLNAVGHSMLPAQCLFCQIFERVRLCVQVALQDHYARILQIPGAKLKPASLKPGASLTLAQRHGLVKAPPRLLSEQQWSSTHAKSTARQDSQHECSICCEHFGMGEQVLLSCSHVFHKQCITSFERFARVRCCPLCRTEAYQKRRVHDGREAHRHRCAAKIQATVRAYLARKWYRQLRRRLPPQNPCLTRKWAAEQLQDNSGRLLKQMAAARDDLDVLFVELDTSLARSKQIFSQVAGSRQTPPIGAAFGSNAALSASSSTHDGLAAAAVAASALQVPAYVHVGDPLVVHEPCAPVSTDETEHINWDQVLSLALQRGSTECAICLGALQRHGSEGVAWLSCTHVYHTDCISTFEAFELSRNSQPSCPCCRAKYLKFPAKLRVRAHQIPAKSSARAAAAVDALCPVLRRNWLLEKPDSQLRRVTLTAGELVVVQDDLLHPVLGGNKLRKLDGLLPEVKATGCTDLLTCGGLQSAHTAAVAAACAEQGIKAHLLVRGERPATPTGFHLLARMFAQVTYIPRSEYADRSAMFKKYAQQITDSTPTDMKLHVLPEGASEPAALLGCIRLVHWLAQPHVLGQQPLTLVVDCGTGVTATGLALGIKLAGLPWQVCGVMLAGPLTYYTDQQTVLTTSFVATYLAGTCGLLLQQPWPSTSLGSCRRHLCAMLWVPASNCTSISTILLGRQLGWFTLLITSVWVCVACTLTLCCSFSCDSFAMSTHSQPQAHSSELE
ncbi:hypothetical protein ABBQ32_003936 [Trebouxia sp. C0010 RCD-2024]